MKNVCLEDDGIVLSNFLRKWCLTVLENGLPAVKNEVTMPCAIVNYDVMLRRLLSSHDS